jgi:hypothetical protein
MILNYLGVPKTHSARLPVVSSPTRMKTLVSSVLRVIRDVVASEEKNSSRSPDPTTSSCICIVQRYIHGNIVRLSTSFFQVHSK